MSPTGLQRDPYGADTEGATIPTAEAVGYANPAPTGLQQHSWQDCLPLFAKHIGGVAQRDEGVDTLSPTHTVWRDCLPLFAEHIGGVSQRDEGVDTLSPTPPSLRDTSPINSAKAP